MNIRKVASLALAVALQVLPITRVFIASTPAAGSSFAIVSTWIAGALALMGAVDAVSGASTTITSATTARGTNGVPFSYRITTGPDVANTYAAAPLPTGLTVSTTSGKITGTPTVSGVFVVLLTASDSGRLDRTVKTNLTLTIVDSGGSGGAIAPAITTQPVSQTVTAGGNANFTVVASGTAPLSYQWRQNGVNLPGATTSTLALTGVTAGQAGSYTVAVSNSVGGVISSAATLTVNAAPVAPSITTQPVSQTVTAGGNATFTVVASGSAPLSYQWRQNGVNLPGATTSTLALTGVTAGQAGSYTVAVSNSVGGVISSAATLTVNAAPVAPSITTQPVSQTVTAGGNATFTVVASGSAPLSYQWRQNGVNLAGATTSTLALTGVTAGQAGSYTVAVSNSVGGVISSAATLTVAAAPVAPSITTQPVSQTVMAGGNANFTVVASGTAPLSYQWRQNGANLAGATTSTLALTGVTTNQAGNYTVVITNSAGSVTSSAAVLMVTQPDPVSDVTRPTVAVTSPAANVVANPSVIVGGTASDNIGVKTVWYSINGGSFNNATGSANWAVWGTPAPVPLTPGTNIVQVYSVDLADNCSLTNSRSFIYEPSGALSLVIVGAGRVTGATNGQPLQTGGVLKLKAIPATGNVFSNWVGVVNGTLVCMSNSSVLNIPIQPKLEITANFVPNPFLAVAGQFNGLFYETNEVKVATAGFFTLKLSERGTYTAAFLSDGRRLSAAGQFEVGGKAANTVARRGTNALTVAWDLFSSGADQIIGTVGDGNWSAVLTGDRAGFNARTYPCVYAGKYTFVLPGTPGATLTPEGNSYGTVSINNNGVVNLKGYLASKSSIAQKVPLAKNGEWPLYVPLKSRKGALLAWISFADRPTDDFSGLAIWALPPLASAAYYPSGFTVAQTLAGSRYTPPTSEDDRVLNLTNAIVFLSGGDLPQPYTNGVVIGAGSQVTQAYPNDLTATFTLSSGLFRGTFKPEGDNGPVAFSGAVLQKTTNAFGCFFGNNESGHVALRRGTLPRTNDPDED